MQITSALALTNTAPASTLQGLKWLAGVFANNFLREAIFYVLAAAAMWFLFHVFLKDKLKHRIIAKWPSGTDIRREVVYSISSLCIFSALGLVVFSQVIQGHFTIYFKVQEFGWVWLVVSLPLMILWHDFYFYWTHRLLHNKKIFRYVHSVHHRSRNPSPWAAYAFHPVEAIVNGLVVPLALCVVPLHGLVLFVFSIHQVVRNTHGHAALETMPHGFAQHWLGSRFTTTTHHHMHHETAQGNYGLWFTWWDRLCKTENPAYVQRFDAVTQAPSVPLPA